MKRRRRCVTELGERLTPDDASSEERADVEELLRVADDANAAIVEGVVRGLSKASARSLRALGLTTAKKGRR